jgi:3-methyladenine DNA glycosylase/8-oxoguanine DNA glycosylase
VTASGHTERVAPLVIALDRPIDLRLTLGIHLRGFGDPSLRFVGGREVWRATRTADGPATVRLEPGQSSIRAEAWGPGAEAALHAVPGLVGVNDEPDALEPVHPLVRELARRLRGLRIGRTGAVMESLVPAILEQKVTGGQAHRGLRGLIRRFGEPAPRPPGNAGPELWLQPSPNRLAGLPYFAFHPCDIERRRADTIRRAAAVADRLEALAAAPAEAAATRLRAIPGVGSWTAAEVTIRALGDVDAVSVGDFHLPSVVAWTLAGEPRGTDERMLELLEPYRGQRGRVIRMLELSGIQPPAFGPRMAHRRIATD